MSKLWNINLVEDERSLDEFQTKNLSSIAAFVLFEITLKTCSAFLLVFKKHIGCSIQFSFCYFWFIPLYKVTHEKRKRSGDVSRVVSIFSPNILAFQI